MKIAVIGAGIIGVTTAYELGRDGHEVSVFERRGAAAEESSFANAGVVAPGHDMPWAMPGMPRKIASQLLRQHASVRIGFPLGKSEMAWMWKWYRSCTLERYLTNRAHMRRLAFYSRARMLSIRTDLRLEYDRSDGHLVLLRTDRDIQMAQPGLQLLRDAGVAFRQLEPAQARLVEPALSADTPFAGAIELPDDEVGNCRQFALLLKNEAQRTGVRFRFDTTVSAITQNVRPSLVIQGEPSPSEFDAVVICAGVSASQLLRPRGLDLPLVAVHGYSLSASIKEPLNSPRSAVTDEHYKVAVARLGNRIRVAGGAELGGAPDRKRESSLQTLYKVLHDWFPGAASRTNTIQEWKGNQPMFPDGPPVVGYGGQPGLWLNIGHGSSGWALACGSARALADQILGHQPELDMQGFDLERLAR